MVRISKELVDKSKQYLNSINEYELNLRNNYIFELDNLTITNNYFESIDLCNNNIVELPKLPKLSKLKTLNLSNNKIDTVISKYSENLPNLQNLLLTNNLIISLKEIDNISLGSKLIRLSLLDNPVTKYPIYRLYTVFKIPSLKVLDFQKISIFEKKQAKKIFSKLSEKEIDSIIVELNNKVKFGEGIDGMETDIIKSINNSVQALENKRKLIEKIKKTSNLNDLQLLEKSELNKIIN